MQTKEYAKQIREELKKAFPGIKFSVRTSLYSMGSSINVRWVDGPVQKDVEEVIRKYEQVSRDQWGEILSGGNMYVFANRDYSAQMGGILLSNIDLRDNNIPTLEALANNAYDYLRHFARAFRMVKSEESFQIECEYMGADLERVRDAFINLGYETFIENKKLVVTK